MNSIKFKLLRVGAKLPSRAYEGDSGMDLYACMPIGCVLYSGHTTLIPTGVACELPEGYEGQVRPRSSISKLGIITHFGTIDNGYRGEIGVRITNVNPALRFEINPGDKIAQLVLASNVHMNIEPISEFSDNTERGERGYGSSGK